MLIDKTDPTITSNYLWFPYAVKTTKWNETALKIASIFAHVSLSIITFGIFTIVTVGKYFFEDRKISIKNGSANIKNESNVNFALHSADLKYGIEHLDQVCKFDTVEELRTNIERQIEGLRPRKELRAVIYAGTNILENPKKLDYIEQSYTPTFHVILGNLYTPEELVGTLYYNECIGNISFMKPVATEHSGAGEITRNFKRLAPEQQQWVLNSFSKNLSEATGENVSIKVGNSPGGLLLFYSEYHLSYLAEIAGLTIEEALTILEALQPNDSEAMDFIKLAFGDLTKEPPLSRYQELTDRGKIWYQKYFDARDKKFGIRDL